MLKRDWTLRYIEGSALVPLHHRANRAQMLKPGLSSSADEIRAQLIWDGAIGDDGGVHPIWPDR
jgi:hypothetical protein